MSTCKLVVLLLMCFYQQMEKREESTRGKLKPALLRVAGGLTFLAGLGTLFLGTNHYIDEMNKEARTAQTITDELWAIDHRFETNEYASAEEFALRLEESKLKAQLSETIDDHSDAETNALGCIAVGATASVLGGYVLVSSFLDES